ncbi:MSN2-like protein [Stemphylium lycopersici]|uniref:MSN2-like protein n=1 Tax=Stemphylium lycopersici TaxID=183478 RepID=A0A364NDZ4_STELY|nr:MSN2-like protein [Stemphylium lycopersici]
MGSFYVQYPFLMSPHHSPDHAHPHRLVRCDLETPVTPVAGREFFDEDSNRQHYAQEATTNSSSNAPVSFFGSHKRGERPCGSPPPTSSSTSHTESVPTPPYTGMAVYNQADSPPYQHIHSLTGYDAWSEEPEPVWRPSYPDTTTPIHTNQHPGAPFSCSPPLSSSTASFGCRSSTPSTIGASWGSQEYSLPYQDDPSCNQLHLQPLQGYIPQAGPSAGTTYSSYSASIHYPTAGYIDRVSYKQRLTKDPKDIEIKIESDSATEDIEIKIESDLAPEDSGSDDDDSSQQSAPEDSESDDDDSSQQSFHSTSRGYRANSRVMKLGKWSTMPCSFPSASEPRPYVCHLEDKDHPGNPCPKRFVRPEHLRRHVRTVHSAVRDHGCKVCPRHFSRGDNLRDHYWTHLQRGGRKGKNDKMSLPELKAFLGPKEKLLVNHLQRKLHNTQKKQAN